VGQTVRHARYTGLARLSADRLCERVAVESVDHVLQLEGGDGTNRAHRLSHELPLELGGLVLLRLDPPLGRAVAREKHDRHEDGHNKRHAPGVDQADHDHAHRGADEAHLGAGGVSMGAGDDAHVVRKLRAQRAGRQLVMQGDLLMHQRREELDAQPLDHGGRTHAERPVAEAREELDDTEEEEAERVEVRLLRHLVNVLLEERGQHQAEQHGHRWGRGTANEGAEEPERDEVPLGTTERPEPKH